MEDVIIRIEDAAVSFEKFSVKPAIIEIPKGYVIGIQGSNGAGKTTFLNMIMGQYKNMQGKISIDGCDVIRQKTEIMNKLGFISQEREFFLEEDSKANELMYAPFYAKWDSEVYSSMLKKMNISKSRILKTLSTGEMIKYQLAFAAAYKPQVLILDEPTANLDSVFRDDFLKLLQEFVAEYETTILLSTHLQEDLSKIADYIIEIHDGNYKMREAEV